MSDVANLTASGRLGQDAAIKDTQAGPVLSWTMAVDTGKKETAWLRCSLFGKRAQSLQQYMVKGTRVVVTGRLRVREYDAKDGQRKTSVEVDVNDVALVGGKRDENAAPQASASRYGKSGAGANAKHTAPSEPEFEDDDTLPF